MHLIFHFHLNEEDHDFVSQEKKAWCHWKAQECADAIWQGFCETVTAALPLSAPLQPPIAEAAAIDSMLGPLN
ncbi:hypothetical protein C0995_006512, partial [Termitomyces sp. Mi166